MCGCGGRRQEVITTAQLEAQSAELAEMAARDAANRAETERISATNAVANAASN